MAKEALAVASQNPIPTPMNIRYKGVWDMQDLYEGTISYLRERKWKFHEKIYKHKHPSPYGVERQYVWLAEQDVDEYLNVTINIYIHTYDAHDIEAIDKEGNKRIFTKGKIWITLKIAMNFDSTKRFHGSRFMNSIAKFYLNYVIKKKRMQGYSPRYRHELLALYQYFQRRLRMETKDYEYSNIAGVHRRGP